MIKRICVIILALAIVIAGCLLVARACNRNDTSNDIKSQSITYLANGSIPASAKIYPIMYDDISLTIYDQYNIIDSDDVWALTHYVDVWSTCDDTRGEGFRTDEAQTFVSDELIEQVVTDIADSNENYSVDGVQPISFTSDDEGRVEAIYIVQLTGCSLDDGVDEGTYESVNTLRFAKVDDEWVLDGVSFLGFGVVGTFEYSQDDITGDTTITVVGETIA